LKGHVLDPARSGPLAAASMPRPFLAQH
jgi:hypothetical protein